MLFLTKYEKMNYIRDYYKIIAFDILKIRINPINNDFYVILKEIIKELYNIFEKYNKLIKCDIELYNLIFIIKINFKKNKIFDKFYTRFLITVISLNYSEIYKISILKRFIIIKLRLQTLNDTIFLYRQYIKRLKRYNQNLRL